MYHGIEGVNQLCAFQGAGIEVGNLSDTTASAGGSDDEIGSTAATDGSTLRTSPAEHGGSAGSESGGSNVDSGRRSRLASVCLSLLSAPSPSLHQPRHPRALFLSALSPCPHQPRHPHAAFLSTLSPSPHQPRHPHAAFLLALSPSPHQPWHPHALFTLSPPVLLPSRFRHCVPIWPPHTLSLCPRWPSCPRRRPRCPQWAAGVARTATRRRRARPPAAGVRRAAWGVLGAAAGRRGRRTPPTSRPTRPTRRAACTPCDSPCSQSWPPTCPACSTAAACAPSRSCRWVLPAGRPSVCPSVRPSVRLCVRLSMYLYICICTM